MFEDQTMDLWHRLSTGAKPSGTAWATKCPAHEDNSPSLGFGMNADRSVWLKCHKGCDVEAVVLALGYGEGTVRVKGLSEWPRLACVS